MSYSIITGPALIDRLKSAITAGPDIRLAVAFWGAGASKALGLTQGKNARVICNLMSGGTNPAEIRTLRANGIDVRKHAALHAKIGVVGDGLSFVGSSNMSANGLGFEGRELTGWEEANVVFDHADSDVSVRFDALWEGATRITKADLKAAEDLWRRRRTFAIQSGSNPVERPMSLWQAIVDNDDRLRSSPCVVAYYYEMDDDDKLKFSKAEKNIRAEYGKGLSAFMDWDALPDGYILSACRARKFARKIKHVAVSLKAPNSPTYTDRDGTPFQVVTEPVDLPGFTKLKGEDLRRFNNLLIDFVGEKKIEESRIIPIRKLMDFYVGENEQ